MKNFRRALCMVLSLVFVLQLFAGCSSEQTDETIYLTKGEFFAYFVYENEMSSEKYTAEEIFNSYDGAIEADIIVEWGYLPEALAKNDLEDPVTKEIVVMVCANSIFELKKGNTADIKDASLLEDPQLIADAYASGFFELENGYFDGAVPMEFWKLLALYICTNTLSSLPWAIPFGEKEIQTMRTQAGEVFRWYDGMQTVIPAWYQTEPSI